MKRDSLWAGALCRVYAILLYAYPREFRNRFGAEMRQVFRDRCGVAAANPATLIPFFLATARDWFLSSTKERIANMTMTIWQRRAARCLGVAVLTVLAFLLITTKVMQAYVISASSMEGSLWRGDHILVNKLAHGGEV